MLHNRLTRIMTAVVALSLVGWTIWLHRHNQPIASSLKATDYDSAGTHLIETNYDEHGSAVSVVNVASEKEYAQQSRYTLEQPHLIRTMHSGVWIIDAQHGKYNQNQDKLYLWGHVTMRQPRQDTSGDVIIRTSHAVVNSKTQLAHTSAKVTIDQDGNHTQGVGAVANLNTGEVTLLSHTKGHYESTIATQH